MTKREWDRELLINIAMLPREEKERVAAYYDELYSDKAESGMSEREILKEFGFPYDAAKKIIADYEAENGKVDDGFKKQSQGSAGSSDGYEDDRPNFIKNFAGKMRDTIIKAKNELLYGNSEGVYSGCENDDRPESVRRFADEVRRGMSGRESESYGGRNENDSRSGGFSDTIYSDENRNGTYSDEACANKMNRAEDEPKKKKGGGWGVFFKVLFCIPFFIVVFVLFVAAIAVFASFVASVAAGAAVAVAGVIGLAVPMVGLAKIGFGIAAIGAGILLLYICFKLFKLPVIMLKGFFKSKVRN